MEVWFQSHAGSIEASALRLTGNIIYMFQSHAGSIEAAAPPVPGPGTLVFQSHAGSIEASEQGGGMEVEMVTFQSHAGSIEASLLLARFGPVVSVSIPRWFD